MKKFGEFYWWFAAMWYVVGFFFHIMALAYAIGKGAWEMLVVLALWWAVTLTGRAIRHAIMKKYREKEEAKLRAYKEQYVTEIPVEDERFGKVVFEYNSEHDTLTANDINLEKPFGGHELTLFSEFSGNNPDLAVGVLGYLYDHCDEILEELYPYTVSCCENYDERDKDGNPYDLEYVRKNLSMHLADIAEYNGTVIIHLCGSICGDTGDVLLGCHSVTSTRQLRADDLTLIDSMCGLEG